MSSPAIEVCIDDHGLINPANFPCKAAELDTSVITGSADKVTAIGTGVLDAAQAASTAWTGLQTPGVFETPDHAAVCALMKPAVDGATDMQGVTSRIGTAITTYAEALEGIKPDLEAFEKRAETFRTRALQGYEVTNLEAYGSAAFSTYYPGGFPANLIGTSADPTAKTTIDWIEHGPAVEKNKAMLAEYNQILERISTAATTCAASIQRELTLVCMAAPETITAEMLDANPDFSSWGQPTEEDRNCSESVGHGAGNWWHNTWTSAASLIGRDPVTGDWSWATVGKSLLGVGDFLLSTVILVVPGVNIAAAAYSVNSDSEFANFLGDRLNVAIGSWGGLIGWDQQAHMAGENGWHKWEEDGIAALTESGLNIATFFIPGAGVAGNVAKTALRGTKVGSFVVKAAHGLEFVIPGGSHLAAVTIRVVDFGVDSIKTGWRKLTDLVPRLPGHHPDAPRFDLPDNPHTPNGPSRVPDHTPFSESHGLDRPKADGPDGPTTHPPTDVDPDVRPGHGPDAPTSAPDGGPVTDRHGRPYWFDDDGRRHLKNDPEGTFRDEDGRLHDGKGFATDPQKVDPSGLPIENAVKGETVRGYEVDADFRASHDDLVAAQTERSAAAAEATARLDDAAHKAGIDPEKLKHSEEKVTETLRKMAADGEIRQRDVQHLTELANQRRTATTAVNNGSQVLGEHAAEAVSEARGQTTIIHAKDGAGANQLDHVTLSAEPPTLNVYEAKGGSGQTTPRTVDGVRVHQGTSAYLNDLLHVDGRVVEGLRDYMRRPDADPTIVQAIQDGTLKVRYELVRGRTDGRIDVTEFVIDASKITIPRPSL
ncbi:MAG: hypothetical protein QM713_10030 [Arachnia sp.]